MSETTCVVFHPTEQEFQDFRTYIENIELKNPHLGMCKIVPPPSWCVRAAGDYKLDELDLLIPSPTKQVVSGRGGVYQVDLFESHHMTLQQFMKYCDSRRPESDLYADRERRFWTSIGFSAGMGYDPLYGADVPGSLFNGEESHPHWNLNHLENLLQVLDSKVPGVNLPMLYVGSWRAMFAFHCEDVDLYSINYLHVGAEKSWYCVPPTHRKKFETMAECLFEGDRQMCPEFLRHKTKLFSPTKLKSMSVQFTTCVQQPGEFVITFPGSYHSGFNHGFNIAEAVNFAFKRWISIGRSAKRCLCRPESVNIDVNLLETLYLRKRVAHKHNSMEIRGILRNEAISDYFMEENINDAVDYFDEDEGRIRCYCSATNVYNGTFSSPKQSNCKKSSCGESSSTASNGIDLSAVKCKGCELWFHVDCVKTAYTNIYDLRFLEVPYCHYCNMADSKNVNLNTETCGKPKKRRLVNEETAIDRKKTGTKPIHNLIQLALEMRCMGAVVTEVVAADEPNNMSSDVSSSRNIKTQNKERKAAVKKRKILCGDMVRVTLPGALIETFGYIADIDGKFGRLHIKGTKRVDDTWVLLSQCTIYESEHKNERICIADITTPQDEDLDSDSGESLKSEDSQDGVQTTLLEVKDSSNDFSDVEGELNVDDKNVCLFVPEPLLDCIDDLQHRGSDHEEFKIQASPTHEGEDDVQICLRSIDSTNILTASNPVLEKMTPVVIECIDLTSVPYYVDLVDESDGDV